MTSRLVAEMIERAGLAPLLDERARGAAPSDAAGLLARTEILALGAAADAARRRECTGEVSIYVPSPPAPSDAVHVLGRDATERGTAFLRRVATLRLTGPVGQRIVVDFGALGLEVAQVALSFGASDLAGPLASRRGLPLVDVEDRKKLVKRREIAAYVERAGFRAVFVSHDPPAPTTPREGAPSRPHVDS